MEPTEDFGDSTPIPAFSDEEETPKLPTADEHTAGYAAETVNLVATLTDEEQKKLADTVWEDWDRDYRSGEKHRQHYADIIKLYTGLMPPKEAGYAQVHFGIILKAIQRLHARIYDQQLPSNGEFFGCHPMDATDVERSIRVAKHLNWAILTQVPNYVQNIDVLILQWFLYGSAFTYVYWDPISERPCHEVCATEDIILPYARKSTDPSLADMPRITRVCRKYRFGIDGIDVLAKSGYYDKVNCDAIFADKAGQPDRENSNDQIQETIDRASGVKPPEGDERDKDGRRVLLNQHRWWQLPGSDEYRPVEVTIDRDMRKLLCLKLRESEDQQDQARYNREKAANEASYAAAMEQFQAEMLVYQANVAAFPQPMIPPTVTLPPAPGEVTATPAPMPGETTATMPGMPPMPVPPPQPPEPAPPRMVPINSFTHYVCLPNPEGVYGFGIGYLLAGDNIMADAIASILVTSGKLASTATGIRSRQSKLSGGEFKIKPGEFPEVDVPPEQLDKVLFQLKFPPPDAGLWKVVEGCQQDADEISGAGDILSGEVGGSNETATTTQIRISQALQAISIQNKRFTRARTAEGQKFARLFSIYLSDKEYFPVVSPYKVGPPGEGNIGRIDYLQDCDIYVTADPRMASQPQRVQEATTALQTILSGPLAQIPQFFPLVIAAYRNLFIAMDRPDLVAGLESGGSAMAMMPAPGMPGMAPGAPQPGGPPQGEGPPEGGQKQPRPAPMEPPVPNAGPTPQNGAMAA